MLHYSLIFYSSAGYGMASPTFSWQQFFIRFLFALILVYSSYNPSGYSVYHWLIATVVDNEQAVSPPLILAVVSLIIGWTIYIRATLRSLGLIGLGLAFAFFATLIWWFIDSGWLALTDLTILSYIILLLMALILATGMSWSHIRRRLSGQSDVDDISE